MDVERWKDGAGRGCIASHLAAHREKTRLAVFPRAEADGALSASRAKLQQRVRVPRAA